MGVIKITFKVDGMETTVEGDENKTLLDTAIENDVDAPYSCRGGACATCIGRLKTGTVNLEQNYILTDSEIDEGLIITCQAYPTSDEILYPNNLKKPKRIIIKKNSKKYLINIIISRSNIYKTVFLDQLIIQLSKNLYLF